jgi:tRNA(Ile)-lysidine synthase
MLARFQEHLNENLPFLQGKKLLVAVSGGIDSMVLVSLLRQLNFSTAIAHCNFNLRGQQSTDDESFIRNYASDNSLTVHISGFDTNKFADDTGLSVQMAARSLRYAFFEELAKEQNYDYVLTAHHWDDNLETFLINLARGSGIDGLVGIPVQRDIFVRPLLPFSRKEIESYALAQNIAWREDSSNTETKYTRNALRLDVIPALKKATATFEAGFTKTIANLQQTQSMADDAAILIWKQVVVESEDKIMFKIQELFMLPNYKAYLYYWLHRYGFTSWDDIYQLPFAQSGKRVLGRDFVLVRDRGVLILAPIKEVNDNSYPISAGENLFSPVALDVSEVEVIGKPANNCIFVDAQKLQFPLTLRHWQQGDVFVPFGLAGKQKISKYFKDQKLSVLEKSKVWLLLSGEQIVWVVGYRPDDRFKVTPETKKIVQIKSL